MRTSGCRIAVRRIVVPAVVAAGCCGILLLAGVADGFGWRPTPADASSVELWRRKQPKGGSLQRLHHRPPQKEDDVSLPFDKNEGTDNTEQGVNAPRRTLLATALVAAILTSTSQLLQPTAAAFAATTDTATTALSPDQAVVTDKVFFDVRISRQDGSFYVRDDLPDTIENQVFQGRLTFGLFGRATPNHVQRFISYVETGNKPLDDNPLPSYGRSVFPLFDPATGVLYGGEIPSLEVTELGSSTAIRYGGRLLPAKLWMSGGANEQKIRHSAKGLLTHRNLDVTPRFGITTRTDTTELDRTHTVFGKLLLDDPAAKAFLQRVSELPVYSVDRPVAASDDDSTSPLLEDAASAVYRMQRDFFRGAAKNLGDDRVDKLVAGKLLRRVEVTRVGLL